MSDETPPPPPPFKPNHILLLGATGTIGKYITTAILSSPKPIAPHITILTSPSSSPSKKSLLSSFSSLASSSPLHSFRTISTSLSPASNILPIYRGDERNDPSIPPVDTVISALGRGALGQQVELLRLFDEFESSEEEESENSSSSSSPKIIRWFLPSEYGTDVEYDESSGGEKPHQMKLGVRRFARGGEGEGEGKRNLKRTRCTYLVTGPYLEMFLEMKNEISGGFDVSGRKARLVEGERGGKIGFCSMPDVGKFVVATLRNPRYAMEKEVLKVQSFVTTPREILAEFEKQTMTGGDKKKWEDVKFTSLEELRRGEKKAWDEGDTGATGYTLRRIWAEGKTLYGEGTDNEGLGVRGEELESLGDVVGRAVEGKGY